ncbi:2-oxo-4-hydroxy-4-carboxy-5-ureidoimidazoline decarboxylase [Catellatospora sp. IY07-71]|uniref:2-oxo-4-hydroxy-4-carboxy-5-ureidoimidazoline decarboxylase n=1 Tax=Catellatospora sp. IY07-71 TaxID=2728827 RepID=UPI001BB34D0F|nr:2-oxo-4-hydroxy-4-carboxy-5-ureidoimidazoline decarboxylase [Catellatospora sp. IY07-71]BCJ77387.1 2-oxo-4-hydroxy-4-carboxy-5-ureidoimidazoline decarboxylase [Catellatospora sp. IY07-71]
MSLAAFNDLPQAQAEEELLACCAAAAWARAVAAGRPYPGHAELREVAAGAVAALSWPDIAQALAAHPRIGERAAGASREAAWSRQEQSGATAAGEQTATALIDANRAYEKRFGHVFLIFASGKSAEQMLAAARERLGHDEATEREVVRRELTAITLLRLERLVTA